MRRGLVGLRSTRARRSLHGRGAPGGGPGERRWPSSRNGGIDLAAVGARGARRSARAGSTCPTCRAARTRCTARSGPTASACSSIPLVYGLGTRCWACWDWRAGRRPTPSRCRTGLLRDAAAGGGRGRGHREPRLEYAEAVNVPALLQRLQEASLAEVPEDQIVRVNVICRSLVKRKLRLSAAPPRIARLTVHILREYTSRSPRIIDVDALRTAAARRQEARALGRTRARRAGIDRPRAAPEGRRTRPPRWAGSGGREWMHPPQRGTAGRLRDLRQHPGREQLRRLARGDRPSGRLPAALHLVRHPPRVRGRVDAVDHADADGSRTPSGSRWSS